MADPAPDNRIVETAEHALNHSASSCALVPLEKLDATAVTVSIIQTLDLYYTDVKLTPFHPLYKHLM